MAGEDDLCFNISPDPNGSAVCSSSSWRASASDDYGCRAASTTNGSCGLAIPRIAAGGNERSGAWLDAARSNAAGMRRSGAPSLAQTTIRECPHSVDSRRRGRTTQLSPSIGPRSTGLRRRLVRQRGVRLQVEQMSFSQNYQHEDGKGTTVARALMCFLLPSGMKASGKRLCSNVVFNNGIMSSKARDLLCYLLMVIVFLCSFV